MVVAGGVPARLHVAACADCHSPKRADDSPVPELWLSGIDCFVDEHAHRRLGHGPLAVPARRDAFKEFSAAGRRIETRVIVRTGEGPRDYWMGAFVWDDDEADARFVAGGQVDARGTHHDVPSARQCGACHNGEPGRILGFSAVQQPHVAPELLDRMATRAEAPDDAVAAAALGHLHANCGHCHNPNGSARPDTDMDLRLSIVDRRVEDTGAYRTAVARPMRTGAAGLRIAPGSADQSGVVIRMSQRGTGAQMPPLGSEAIDAAGVDLVRAWIDSL